MSQVEHGALPAACPRCRSATIEVRSTSPLTGVWTVFACATCLYGWRSTEPKENRDPDSYPAAFRLKPEVLPNLPVAPSIPALRRPAGDKT
jgi:vanillate/4-hydroxybenzoate decarboxylase subunit D